MNEEGAQVRGLYIANYDLNDNNSGVSKKINNQLKQFRANSLDVDALDSNCVVGKKHRLSSIFLDYFFGIIGYSSRAMLKLLNIAYGRISAGEQYDFLYIRKGFLDTHLVKVLQRIKRHNCKIVILMEIPTFPYVQEFRPWDLFLKRNEKKAVKRLKGCVDYIVTFSNDGSIYGVPTVCISNGIDFLKTPQRCPKAHDGVNLLAVALFDRWHGYDRIIEGMARNRDFVDAEKIRLFLVGKGRAINQYRKIVRRYNMENHVFFMGEKHGSELEEIYNISDIGVDCLARHRVGVSYNSTLKGKEYCAAGLPIISGVSTDLDKLPAYNYYKRFPADDSPINVFEIVDFYNSIYSKEDPTLVSKRIREYTKEIFDISITQKPVIDLIYRIKNSTNDLC